MSPDGVTLGVLGAVFTGGFLGSAHCIGMCGPLVLASTAPGGGRTPTLQRLGLYQLGRVTSYAALGALAGGLGAALDLAGALAGLSRVALVVAGAIMIGSGVLTLARLWSGRGATGRSGGALGAWLSRQVGARLRRVPPTLRPLLLGATTGLLPCGFLWSFALGAAGTGHPLHGALVMGTFALGTLPATLGLAGVAAAIGRRLGSHTTAVVALLVIALGVFTVARRGSMDVRGWVPAQVDAPAPTVPAADAEPACCHGEGEER